MSIPELHGTTYTSLTNKIILLTGIGQSSTSPTLTGNGSSTARLLCASGAKVFGCDLSLASAQVTHSALIQEFGDDCCTVIAADVTKKDDVDRLVAGCLERYGRIDGLVNNVGMSMPGGPAEMSEEVWDGQVAVNLKSVYLCSHAVLPLFEAQGYGNIVNISSVAGLRYIGKPQVAYAACKAAVIHFTKTTAVLYARKGVRVNCVVPGLMHTPLVRVLAEKYAGGDYEGFVEKRNGQVPMGRMGDSYDTANAVIWLLSDNSRYVTGIDMVVDGGFICSTGPV